MVNIQKGLTKSPTLSGWWFQPLWKIWKSVGMIIPNIWKNKIHVPNHQPVVIHFFKSGTPKNEAKPTLSWLSWIRPRVPVGLCHGFTSGTFSFPSDRSNWLSNAARAFKAVEKDRFGHALWAAAWKWPCRPCSIGCLLGTSSKTGLNVPWLG